MTAVAGWYPDPAGTSARRYFDGSEWTEHLTAPWTDEQRAQRLDAEVIAAVRAGGRVEAKSAHNVVLSFHTGLNGSGHIIMAILTVFTCGLFAIPWIFAAIVSGTRRTSLYVDEFGVIVRN